MMPRSFQNTPCIARDSNSLAEHVAEWIVESAAEAIRARGRFTVALSGGSTPEKAYEILTSERYRQRFDWSKAYLFFGDERFVPPDDPRSNYGMAKRAFLDRTPVPPGGVYPIPTDTPTPEAAAAAYTKILAQVFEISESDPPPRFDLVLLGLGDDGHTASLFPGKPALEAKSWVTSSTPGVLPPPVDRITLTFPTINAGRRIAFLVSGEKKAAILREVMESPPDIVRRPASGVHPDNGTLTWLVDEQATRLLASRRTQPVF